MDIDDFQELYEKRYVRNNLVLDKSSHEFYIQQNWEVFEKLTVMRNHRIPELALLKRDLFDIISAWDDEGNRIDTLSNLSKTKRRYPAKLEHIDNVSYRVALKKLEYYSQCTQYLLYSEIGKNRNPYFTAHFTGEFKSGRVRMTPPKKEIGYVTMMHKFREHDKELFEEMVELHLFMIKRRKKRLSRDFELYGRGERAFNGIMKHSAVYPSSGF